MTDQRAPDKAYPRLSPEQVREREFPRARFGRRGLDPAAVVAFLDRVADELAAAQAALALNQWQTARSNGGAWPRPDRQGAFRVVGRARPHPNERPAGRHRR
ncbi:DivIVA domain-containing protein [Plantactinospora siamensis]|uniref:DivIVA domain-containing protein n=1 Tax=Plantactinospora siamensis TaxID=555372 RepID=A0ABV6P3S2_9ACTN